MISFWWEKDPPDFVLKMMSGLMVWMRDIRDDELLSSILWTAISDVVSMIDPEWVDWWISRLELLERPDIMLVARRLSLDVLVWDLG